MFLSRHSIVGISKSAARNPCGLNNTGQAKKPLASRPRPSALVGGAGGGALLERRAGGGRGGGEDQTQEPIVGRQAERWWGMVSRCRATRVNLISQTMIIIFITENGVFSSSYCFFTFLLLVFWRQKVFIRKNCKRHSFNGIG